MFILKCPVYTNRRILIGSIVRRANVRWDIVFKFSVWGRADAPKWKKPGSQKCSNLMMRSRA